MGFLKTLFTGYRLLYQDLTTKHNDLIPRCFTGCGTGLMMIGSAVMAKTALKDDTREVIAECDAAIAEAEKHIEGEKKPARVKRILKAKVVKGWKVVKVFHKGVICETVGAACVGAGLGISEHGKHKAIKAAGAIGTAFAAYRANVRDDLGDEADIRYLTGRKAVKRTEKVDKKTGEITQELEYVQDDDGVTIKKDPDAFKFWFSEETCPSLWNSNYDLRKANLEWVENLITRKLQLAGHISLNDMRREFGGLEPSTMDVGIGGIFGRVIDPNKPKVKQFVNLHFRDDKDFMEGRTDSCWIIFECDPEPIIGRIGKKIKQVEK